MIERRKFITGLVSLIAAPAIVRASSLMSVRVLNIPQLRMFLQGDIVTIDNVFSKDRYTGEKTNKLRQFVVTASGEWGENKIYPMINDSVCSPLPANPIVKVIATPPKEWQYRSSGQF